MKNHYFLHTDGASRGNPGPSGAGAVLFNPQWIEIGRFYRHLGLTTNNAAEYQALILGLNEAIIRNIKNLIINLDSELITNQLNGLYKVRNPQLRLFYNEVQSLLKNFFKIKIFHINREQNTIADYLANQAIDIYNNITLK